MDIPRSFTYVFDDERWIGKLIIGAAIALVSIFIIPAFLLNGYSIAVTRNVMEGQEYPLPEWDEWGRLFRDGVAMFVIQLVYGLPIWLLIGCATVTTVALAGGLESAGEELLAGGIFGIWGLVTCLSIIFGLLLAAVSPVVAVRYASTGEIESAFRFREVVDEVRAHLGHIVLLTVAVLAVGLVLSSALSVIGLIPCLGWMVAIVGSLVIAPFMTFVTGHLYGQLGRLMGAAPATEAKGLSEPEL